MNYDQPEHLKCCCRSRQFRAESNDGWRLSRQHAIVPEKSTDADSHESSHLLVDQRTIISTCEQSVVSQVRSRSAGLQPDIPRNGGLASGIGVTSAAACETGALQQSWTIHLRQLEFGNRPVSQESKPCLKIVETDFHKDPRWNRFVREHPQGSIFHHSLWLQVLKEEFGQEPLLLACVDQNDEFRGILPLFYTRGLPLGISHIGGHCIGRRLSSLPRTPVAGPLSSSADVTKLLVKEAIRRVRSDPGVILQLKVSGNALDGLLEDIAEVPWRDTYALELPDRSQECIRFGNGNQHRKIAWAVGRARRVGVDTREASCEQDLRQWYGLYLETMRRVLVPARPYRFFLHMWRLLQPRGMMRLLLAEKSGSGRPTLLAGSIFLVYGRSTHYAFTGCHTWALALRVNDLLQWEAIQRAHREGFQFYDLGEVAEERQGLVKFKSKWCAKPVKQYRYYYPRIMPKAASNGRGHGIPRSVGWLWKRFPLRWTEFLGSQIYSYL